MAKIATAANACSSEEIVDDKSFVHDPSYLAVEKASCASSQAGNFNSEELKIDVSSSSSSSNSSRGHGNDLNVNEQEQRHAIVDLRCIPDFIDSKDEEKSRGGFMNIREKGSGSTLKSPTGPSTGEKLTTLPVPSGAISRNLNASEFAKLDNSEKVSNKSADSKDDKPYHTMGTVTLDGEALSIPGLVRVSTFATCEAIDIWDEDDDALLENVMVLAENVFILKYFRRYFHEVILVEFTVKGSSDSKSMDPYSSNDNLESLLISNANVMLPTKLHLPGNGTVTGPHCLPSSCEFFYKYESFDEPGCVFWGLVGRNDEGRVEISSDIIFHSPLSTRQGKAQLDALMTCQNSPESSPIKDPNKFKRAEALWEEDIEFEVKCLEIYEVDEDEDDDLTGCLDDDTQTSKTVLFFGRKFLTRYEDTPQESPLINRSSGKQNNRSSSKEKESPTRVRNVPSPCPVPLKSRPRSCMIIVHGLFDSISSVSFSPSHYIFARYFNGLVCIISPEMVETKTLRAFQTHVIEVAEYILKEEYSTPEQLGLFGCGYGATIAAACINERPELFGASIFDCGFYDLIRGSTQEERGIFRGNKDGSDEINGSKGDGDRARRNFDCKTSDDKLSDQDNTLTMQNCQEYGQYLSKLRDEFGDPYINQMQFDDLASISPLHNIPLSNQIYQQIMTQTKSRKANISLDIDWRTYLGGYIEQIAQKFSKIVGIDVDSCYFYIPFVHHLLSKHKLGIKFDDIDDDAISIDSKDSNKIGCGEGKQTQAEGCNTTDDVGSGEYANNKNGDGSGFPAVLVITGNSENFIPPSDSYKYVAQLQLVIGNQPTQVKPQLLCIDDSVHAGNLSWDQMGSIESTISCRQIDSHGHYISRKDCLAKKDAYIFAFFTKNTYSKWQTLDSFSNVD